MPETVREAQQKTFLSANKPCPSLVNLVAGMAPVLPALSYTNLPAQVLR